MVKHTQTICQLLPTNCLSVFDHFKELALKGYIEPRPKTATRNFLQFLPDYRLYYAKFSLPGMLKYKEFSNFFALVILLFYLKIMEHSVVWMTSV